MKKIFLLLLILIPISVNAKTVRYLGDKNRIILNVNGDSISASLNGKESIEIDNFDAYKSAFSSDSASNYPAYIFNEGNNYKFSDKYVKNTNEYFIIGNRYWELSLNPIIDSTTTSLPLNTCDALFGYNLINLLKNNVFKVIYFSIPILLVVLTTIDFFKCVFSDDNKEMKKSFDKLTKRIVATILIFLTPTILIFLIQFVGSDEIKTCVDTFSSTENIKN